MSTTLKAACLGTVGLATLWGTRATKADDIFTNNTLTTPIPLSHEVLVYTSNASIVYTDGTSTNSNYTAGIISLPTDAPATSVNFDLDLPTSTIALPVGAVTGEDVHSLTLLGLDANNNIVVGSNGQETYASILSNVSFATVQTALLNDNAPSLAANINTAPTSPAVIITSGETNGLATFTLTTITSNGTQTLLADANGSQINGSIIINPTPEPTSAALIGIPAIALLTRRKRTI